MPYLDGIRAIAIAGVLVSHFAYDQHWLLANVQWGRLGVDLFFVLSGFLITQILLRYRDAISEPGDVGKYLRLFYSRRALRVFPIYYLTIGLAVLFGYEPVREYLLWHLTYTSNIAIALYKEHLGAANHFWSLSIEEQFYLFWPLLALLVPRKRLYPTILGLIAVGIISRLIPVFVRGFNLDPTLNSRLDLLGMGALLAFYWQNPAAYRRHKTILLLSGFVIGLPLVILVVTNMVGGGILGGVANALAEFGMALFSAALIDRAAQPQPFRILAVLGWRPVRYIGKISYGIYVYHLFVRLLMPSFLQLFHIQAPPPGLAQTLLYSLVSILVASASWYLLESPINRLKDSLAVREHATLRRTA